MTMTADDKRVVLGVFEALTKMTYSELNKFLGSMQIPEMQKLYMKLSYEDYCDRHGITYEEMTTEDFVDAALEDAEYY